MRRVAVALTLLSSSVACGGFLGFGDDDEVVPVSPPGDGGTSDVQSAEGGSEPLAPGCSRHAVRFDGTSDVDAALGAQSWNSFTAGTGSLAFENGQLVVRSNGVGPDVSDEANISFRHDGVIASITCKTSLEVSTFAGEGRFVQLRLFDPARWEGSYIAYGEWTGGMLGAPIQGQRVNDAGTVDVFPRTGAPPGGQKLPLLVEFTTSPSSPTRFHVKLGEVDIAHEPSSPGEPDVARVIFGAFTGAGADAGAYVLRYDPIDCVVCDQQ